MYAQLKVLQKEDPVQRWIFSLHAMIALGMDETAGRDKTCSPWLCIGPTNNYRGSGHYSFSNDRFEDSCLRRSTSSTENFVGVSPLSLSNSWNSSFLLRHAFLQLLCNYLQQHRDKTIEFAIFSLESVLWYLDELRMRTTTSETSRDSVVSCPSSIGRGRCHGNPAWFRLVASIVIFPWITDVSKKKINNNNRTLRIERNRKIVPFHSSRLESQYRRANQRRTLHVFLWCIQLQAMLIRTRMSFCLIVLLLSVAPHAAEQSFLGTHFYLNQDKIFVDNTLKSVSTLARPYDLVAFIRQAERLERVEQLQTYIDAVDEVTETTEHQQINSIDPDPIDSNDKCNDFLRDGESLIFKILKTHLYDTFYIPFELKNISLHPPRDRDTTKILTCSHFCHIDTSKFFSDCLSVTKAIVSSSRSPHVRSFVQHCHALRWTANDSCRRRWNE